MDKLDEESKQFIEFALKQLDAKNRNNLLTEVIGNFCNFWIETPLPALKKLAKEKMIKGSLEHGSPDPNRDYQKELQDEYLDTVLWDLMRRWVEK